MPPRKRADTTVDVEDPAYDGVPTVVVHIDAEPDAAPAVVVPDPPIVAVTVDPDEKEGD